MNPLILLQFLKEKFWNGLGIKVWGLQWICKCLLQNYYVINWRELLHVQFLYSANIIHFTNFIQIIREVIELRIGFSVTWKANGYESKLIDSFPFSEQFGKIESYHLHLIYYPYKSFNSKWEENWSQIEANGLGQIEIGFETDGPGLEVTKCGARWVYEQDIEDLNQIVRGCSNSNSSCNITPYKDDLED